LEKIKKAVGFICGRFAVLSKVPRNKDGSMSMRGTNGFSARWIAIAVIVFAVAGALWFTSRQPGSQQSGEEQSSNQRQRQKPSHPETTEPTYSGPPSYGSVAPVAPDANPQVKSVVEARLSGKNPERLTPFLAPQPFDAKSYEADPEKYLNIVEPGRVFQTAQAGPKVPQLNPRGSLLRSMLQGDTVTLEVLAPAGAPVTFTSFDLGGFENKLTSMTVKADKRGLASVKFTATPGTIGNCNILAGCPLASGQVRFMMDIRLPAAAVASK
jgi:hypothetical protein